MNEDYKSFLFFSFSQNIEIDKIRQPTIDLNDLQALIADVSTIKNSQQTLKKLAQILPSVFETMVLESGKEVNFLEFSFCIDLCYIIITVLVCNLALENKS